MRLRLTFLLSWVGLFFLQAPAWAILIETGPNKQVGGYLVSEDAKQITVRFKTPSGKDKVDVFERSKIKIIHKVDRERLAKFTKDNPKAYRDYAEQLAKQKDDPEATELAFRLFLIAAYHDSPTVGRGCLLSMSAMAAKPEDKRKYRAMAFLLDAKSDQSVLTADVMTTGPSAVPLSKKKENALKFFQMALRRYRNGELTAAKDNANVEGVSYFFGVAPIMSQKGFIQACNDAVCPQCKSKKVQKCTLCSGSGRVNDPMGGFQKCSACNGKGTQKCSACDGTGLGKNHEEQLEVIIRAEVWALDQILPTEPAAKNTAGGNWSNALKNQRLTPIPSLQLETITEFDPRKCVFRNGTWEVP